MPPPLLYSSAPVTAAETLSLSGFDLIPAGVVVVVLIALGAALVVSSLRRKERDE